MTVLLGYLLPALPLTVGLGGLLLRPAAKRTSAALGIAGAASVLVVAALLVTRPGESRHQLPWLDLGGLRVTLGVWLTPQSALLAVTVAAVALAVQVYSVGYLADDDRYAPYAAQISVFTGAMMLVVVAGDLIPLLVGWEVMGVCSYLLIAHDRRLPEAPRAAVKAFLVTRVGDVGFLLGVAILGVQAKSFVIADVLAFHYDPATVTVAGLLLLAGVAGKSAQFPLHTWLPDAMAGPTPISALIHAATMVAAGGYVLVRLYPLLSQSTTVLTVLGVMAAVTILLGALAAAVQVDIKRVLAWSTVSQLGYLTGAVAVGAPAAAMFHLLTHAAFKALLFLAGGVVIHATGRNTMTGGLARAMPLTCGAFVIGVGALAGLPPLAGFWSKDAALAAAAHSHAGVAVVVWPAMLLGVLLTAWYGARLLLLTFAGPARAGHEAGWSMRAPVLLLSVPAALLGLGVFAFGFRDRVGLGELPHLTDVLAPLLLTAAGAGAAWWRWRADRTDPAGVFGRLRPFLAAGCGVDQLQDRLLVRPALALASTVRGVDEVGVGGVVDGVGAAVSGLGGRLAAAHRGPLPRAMTMAGTGALALVAVVAALTWGDVR